MDPTSCPPSAPSPKATAKLLLVLEAVSRAPGVHRLSDVVACTGLAKTSVYRLLGELIANGYVARDAAGLYRPDTNLRILAARVEATDQSKDARAVLTRLQEQVDQTVHLALRSGDRAVYVDKVEGPDQSIRMASRPGVMVQLHCTGLGKAILAHLPEEEVRGYAERNGLPPVTDRAITDIDALLADGQVVRERGFAIDDGENERQIRCIAVPVFDRDRQPIGGISVSTVAALVSREELLAFAEPLERAAAEITTTLDGS